MENIQNSNNLNIYSNCRTCLEEISESKIHYKIFTLPDLVRKFTVCTSLPIEQDDGFPTSVCDSCYTKIHEFYDFQQMCISSRKKFQESINSDKKLENQIKDEQKSSDLLNVVEVKNENTVVRSSSIESISIGHDSRESDDDEPVVKYRKTCREPGLSFECEICNTKFNNIERLEVHKRIHQGLKLFACPQCDKSYARQGRLKDHIRTEHKEESEQIKEKCNAPGCGKSFKTKQTLQQHVKEYHSDLEGNKGKPLFVCEECGKVLKGISTLKNHRFLHTGQPRPYACTQCNKRYMTRCKLKDHLNRHAGIKNFVCPHCGARKSSRSELKVHINYHTKEKTYPCVICDMVFNNIVNFNRHKRIVHEGIKKYACSYCDQSFGKAETRKHHEMTHTGEKPHECTICNKKFIQIVSLKKHQKVHLKATANG